MWALPKGKKKIKKKKSKRGEAAVGVTGCQAVMNAVVHKLICFPAELPMPLAVGSSQSPGPAAQLLSLCQSVGEGCEGTMSPAACQPGTTKCLTLLIPIFWLFLQ